MLRSPLRAITTLTFDIFGTVLDLAGSLEGPTETFLKEQGSDMIGAEFYAQWRARQRIEQFKDTLVMLGHSGYLETCRRALVYTLRANGIDSEPSRVAEFMKVWQDLSPYPDALEGLRRLEIASDWSRCPMGNRFTWRTWRAIGSASTSTGSSRWRRRCIQAAPGGLPDRGQALRRESIRSPDGRGSLIRHHGRQGLRLSRRVRKPLQASLRRYGSISAGRCRQRF